MVGEILIKSAGFGAAAGRFGTQHKKIYSAVTDRLRSHSSRVPRGPRQLGKVKAKGAEIPSDLWGE